MPHCSICGTEIIAITVDQIVQKILSFDEGSKLLIEAPIVRGRKGEYKKSSKIYIKMVLQECA